LIQAGDGATALAAGASGLADGTGAAKDGGSVVADGTTALADAMVAGQTASNTVGALLVAALCLGALALAFVLRSRRGIMAEPPSAAV
jgi:hypothetical protein